MKELKVLEGVYSPREDSFLLEECVKKYAHGKVLDLGTGSGIQGVAAALKGCEVTFSDINPKAIVCARANAIANGVVGRFVLGDMFQNIMGKYDTIIFNPPYVPTDKLEDIATDGGKAGRGLIDRFWGVFGEYVSDCFTVLILESSLNGYENDIIRFGAKVVARRDFDFEDIAVLMLEGK